MKTNPNMKYITVERYGNDQNAINRHVRRNYVIGGTRFWIDKCLEVYPTYYELWVMTNHNIKLIPVDCREYWGDGLSWTAAENKAYEAIQNYLAQAQV